MATNPASYNPLGKETGPISGPPPAVSSKITADIQESAQSEATGSHVPGQDAGSKVGTAEATGGEEKNKAAAASNKKTVLQPYVKNSKPGDKKGCEIRIFKGFQDCTIFKLKPEGSFVIVEPPPNVTVSFHMGHRLGNSLQDVMIRWNQMRGKMALWLPYCDHAGIATQSVKEDYHKNINKVQRRMSCSFDWSREAFNMDPNFSAALNALLSNLDVDNKKSTGPKKKLEAPGYDKIEFGFIIHFKCPLEGSGEAIKVATAPNGYVELYCGTGSIKLTRAHDPKDYKLGKKHDLKLMNILTDNVLMDENACSYQGQSRFDVRYTIQDDLKKIGFLR
ncbi:hypothetical protein BJ878DRAFT_581630 [Calycina marina]|uniref:valine--tRNA ligase n=1 Tax=Calycina marina TaxID=1763456 RepID=A0A9P8CGR6_9HELO|nr:hypothetical protein BJ878DRAFT_581630 [Calycina marina]